MTVTDATASSAVDTRTSLDTLLDVLHRLGRCGCGSCPYLGVQWGTRPNGHGGTLHAWVRVILPGEVKFERCGESINEAAQCVLDAAPGFNTIQFVGTGL